MTRNACLLIGQNGVIVYRGVVVISSDLEYLKVIIDRHSQQGAHLGHDRMVVGFKTTCAISACSWQGVLDTTLCDKVYQ